MSNRVTFGQFNLFPKMRLARAISFPKEYALIHHEEKAAQKARARHRRSSEDRGVNWLASSGGGSALGDFGGVGRIARIRDRRFRERQTPRSSGEGESASGAIEEIRVEAAEELRLSPTQVRSRKPETSRSNSWRDQDIGRSRCSRSGRESDGPQERKLPANSYGGHRLRKGQGGLHSPPQPIRLERH
jgi:hypothetical protein